MVGQNWRFLLCGSTAGLVNGLLGGGGGAILVPLLVGWCGLPQRKALATSVGVMLPVCLLSVTLYALQGNLNITEGLPYIVGGGLGGWLGGRFFQKAKGAWLKRGFALLVIFSGVRCFLP